MKISVICVYNNHELLERQLKQSLDMQDVIFEFVSIDNTLSCFSSASSALNEGARRSTGDILIFSHQDIFLKTGDELRILAEVISDSNIGDIVGTQGVREKSTKYYANMTAGNSFNNVLLQDYNEKKIVVDCVDEGLFGMKRDTWENHHFDEKLCDGWHLYAVESCLWARSQGHNVYVCPIQVHHFSYGNITKSYMKGLIRMADKYRYKFRYIWTTCYKVSSSWIYIRVLYFIWTLNRKFRKKI